MVKFNILNKKVESLYPFRDEYRIPIKVVLEKDESNYSEENEHGEKNYETLEEEFDEGIDSEAPYRKVRFKEENGLVVWVWFEEEEVSNLKEIINSVIEKIELAMKKIEERENIWADQEKQRKLKTENVIQKVKDMVF